MFAILSSYKALLINFKINCIPIFHQFVYTGCEGIHFCGRLVSHTKRPQKIIPDHNSHILIYLKKNPASNRENFFPLTGLLQACQPKIRLSTITPIKPKMEIMVSITVHDRNVCFKVRLKNSLKIQKPESLT